MYVNDEHFSDRLFFVTTPENIDSKKSISKVVPGVLTSEQNTMNVFISNILNYIVHIKW